MVSALISACILDAPDAVLGREPSPIAAIRDTLQPPAYSSCWFLFRTDAVGQRNIAIGRKGEFYDGWGGTEPASPPNLVRYPVGTNGQEVPSVVYKGKLSPLRITGADAQASDELKFAKTDRLVSDNWGRVVGGLLLEVDGRYHYNPVHWPAPQLPVIGEPTRKAFSYEETYLNFQDEAFGYLRPAFDSKEDRLRNISGVGFWVWDLKGHVRTFERPSWAGAQFITATRSYALYYNKQNTRCDSALRLSDQKRVPLTSLANPKKGETFVTAFGMLGHDQVLYCINTKKSAEFRVHRLK